MVQGLLCVPDAAVLPGLQCNTDGGMVCIVCCDTDGGSMHRLHSQPEVGMVCTFNCFAKFCPVSCAHHYPQQISHNRAIAFTDDGTDTHRRSFVVADQGPNRSTYSRPFCDAHNAAQYVAHT